VVSILFGVGLWKRWVEKQAFDYHNEQKLSRLLLVTVQAAESSMQRQSLQALVNRMGVVSVKTEWKPGRGVAAADWPYPAMQGWGVVDRMRSSDVPVMLRRTAIVNQKHYRWRET
jgi:hypothetical protein